jgi:hypothetical protein
MQSKKAHQFLHDVSVVHLTCQLFCVRASWTSQLGKVRQRILLEFHLVLVAAAGAESRSQQAKQQ